MFAHPAVALLLRSSTQPSSFIFLESLDSLDFSMIECDDKVERHRPDCGSLIPSMS